MIKGEYIFGLGIVLDMITTLYGLSKGMMELNILGIIPVLMLNYILLYVCLITINRDRTKLINIILYIIGGFRFLVAIWNLIQIL